MSKRLQVLVPEELDAQVRKAARRSGMSAGAWVRRAIDMALREGVPSESLGDPIARLAALNGPTGDIEDLLFEIEAGRR